MVVEIPGDDQEVGRGGLEGKKGSKNWALASRRTIEVPETDCGGTPACNNLEGAAGEKRARRDEGPAVRQKDGDPATGRLAGRGSSR